MKHPDFGENLRRLRQQRGMTQAQIAPCFDIKQGAYSAWEKGNREPDLSTLCRISEFFGISTDELLGKKTTPKAETERNKSLRSRISKLRENARSVSENAELFLRSIDELEGAL